MKQTKVAFLLAGSLLAGAFSVSAQQGFKITQTFHIASPGGWDYIAVNPQSNKLYVSHGTQVNILDKATGDSLGIIPNTTGVHGIAFNNKSGRGYTSNGRLNNVTVFDLATDKIIEQVKTGENPDAIMYDAITNTVITCNGRSKDLSIIDAATDKVIATIAVGGKPETAVTDMEGHLYVNIEDKNEIVAVDLKSATVINHWSLNGGESPTGLEIDKKTKRLFAGCEKQLVVMDATNGNIVTKLPIGDGCDGVAFDAKLKLVFTSNGTGTVTVIKEESANDFKVLENAVSKKSARTICEDESTHKVYLPAADFEPLPANAPERTRAKMIPGSFQILVMSK